MMFGSPSFLAALITWYIGVVDDRIIIAETHTKNFKNTVIPNINPS